jgi:hypothetical protein
MASPRISITPPGKNRDSTTLAVSPAAALNEKLAVLRAKVQAFANAETPAAAEENAVEASEALKAGAPVAPSPAPKMLSTILLESLESTVKKMQGAASQDLSAAAAEQAIFYINEKLETLDRMFYLLEQKRAMQAAAGNYQHRLDAMQKKIEERDARALAGKLN